MNQPSYGILINNVPIKNAVLYYSPLQFLLLQNCMSLRFTNVWIVQY